MSYDGPTTRGKLMDFMTRRSTRCEPPALWLAAAILTLASARQIRLGSAGSAASDLFDLENHFPTKDQKNVIMIESAKNE